MPLARSAKRLLPTQSPMMDATSPAKTAAWAAIHPLGTIHFFSLIYVYVYACVYIYGEGALGWERDDRLSSWADGAGSTVLECP